MKRTLGCLFYKNLQNVLLLALGSVLDKVYYVINAGPQDFMFIFSLDVFLDVALYTVYVMLEI